MVSAFMLINLTVCISFIKTNCIGISIHISYYNIFNKLSSYKSRMCMSMLLLRYVIYV